MRQLRPAQCQKLRRLHRWVFHLRFWEAGHQLRYSAHVPLSSPVEATLKLQGWATERAEHLLARAASMQVLICHTMTPVYCMSGHISQTWFWFSSMHLQPLHSTLDNTLSLIAHCTAVTNEASLTSGDPVQGSPRAALPDVASPELPWQWCWRLVSLDILPGEAQIGLSSLVLFVC